MFTCTVLTQCPESALASAIEMPGWSHTAEDDWKKIPVSWYPFENLSRRIFFRAANRTAAVKQVSRAGLNVRDLVAI